MFSRQASRWLVAAALASLVLWPAAVSASAAWDVDATYLYTITHNNPDAAASHNLTVTAGADGACPYHVHFYGHTPQNVEIVSDQSGLSWTVDETDNGAVVTISAAEPVKAGEQWTFSINYTITSGEFTEQRVDIALPQPQPDGIFRRGEIVLSVPGEYLLFSNFPSVVSRREDGDSKLVTWTPATIPTVVKASFSLGTRPIFTFDNIMRVGFVSAMVLVAVFIIFILLSHSRHRRRRDRSEARQA